MISRIAAELSLIALLHTLTPRKPLLMHSEPGRYLILKKIAVGGMAEIFLARRVSLGDFSKFIVIKRLAPEYQGKRSFERLFLNEARLTARLSHPNIVQVHDIGTNDGAHFMAMEYIHGVTSAEMMSRAAQLKRPVPLGVALGVALATARALEYCSQALNYEGEALEILHHDVSPHNIQIRYDGEVKLLDFGVATQLSTDNSSSRRGKFAYMSPEAYHRMPLDARSDMFSLGVVLYELTMGRRLFKGKTQEETRQRAEQCEVPRPRDIHPRFPEALEELLLKALAKDREARFHSFSELRAEIERVARHLKLDISPHRVSRYLHELYEEQIDARTSQLQTLAARAEAMREESLDELSVIKTRESAHVTLEELEREREEALQVASHEGTSTGEAQGDAGVMEPISANTPDAEALFGSESLEGGSLEGEPLEGERFEAAEGAVALPPNFTELAQLEGVAQPELSDQRGSASPASSSPASSSPARRGLSPLVTLIALVVLSAGAFIAGQQLGSAATPWAPWARPAPTLFSVKSEPLGAQVLINGVPRGVTPLEYQTEDLTFELQLIKAGYQSVTRDVDLQAGERMSMELTLEER